MLTYIARRILLSIPVLIAMSFLVFLLVSLSGDPLASLKMNPRIKESTIREIEVRKHLDKPVIVQYGYWVKEFVTNKFGTTLLSDDPIAPDLTRVLGNTLQLVVGAEILAVLLAVGIGIYSAVKQYSVFDYTATTFSFVGFSTPVFWLALILQILVTNLYVSTGFRLFYTSGLNSATPGNFWLDRIQHLMLPMIVLSVAGIAQYSRYMRASMLEVVHSDYIRTARAKGLSERRVIMRHAFRNALIPLTTVVALDFGALFGGAIVTEFIFSLDGMGQYFINALQVRDVYPIMAWLMLTGGMIILFNLIADVAYGFLDPRVRYE
ncbi:MAG TPA: ABC transporter permease [Actinomycetota bacterium]|nr:ABC transporter permease [Actinomycetota bacterium]